MGDRAMTEQRIAHLPSKDKKEPQRTRRMIPIHYIRKEKVGKEKAGAKTDGFEREKLKAIEARDLKGGTKLNREGKGQRSFDGSGNRKVDEGENRSTWKNCDPPMSG